MVKAASVVWPSRSREQLFWGLEGDFRLSHPPRWLVSSRKGLPWHQNPGQDALKTTP